MPKFKAITHGHARNGHYSATYQSWRSMKSRCAPNRQYGLLGITVCERWGLFLNFLADMGERPDGTELDRRDTKGNYEPKNCRWLVKRENRQTKRNTVMTPEMQVKVSHLLYDGKNHKEISDTLGIKQSTVQKFASGRYWS